MGRGANGHIGAVVTRLVAVLGGRHDPAAITEAFIAALLCIALCLATGAGLGITLARRPATGSAK
jgi:hypothetical protein